MIRWFKRLTPETFKNRILLAVLLFVLTPIALLVLYNFKETERVLQENAAAKNMEQLEDIKNSFVDVMSIVMKTGLLLEQDTTLRSALQNPEQYDAIKRKSIVENRFAAIENSFFLTGATVYYTLLDLHSNVYTSFNPSNALDYEELKREAWVEALGKEGGERYFWNPSDSNYVYREQTKSRNMLSLYELLRDDGLKPFAYGRFSIDYEDWFIRTTKGRQGEGAYFLLDASGHTTLQSVAGDSIKKSVVEQIVSTSGEALFTALVDEQEREQYTFSYIPELKGYIVKKVPLSLLFQEVDKLKQRFFLGFSLILLLFVLLIYFISSTITVPLKRFQKKMESTVKANLKVNLKEDGRGEILALTQSFNMMINDINGLLERLKLEERQKQFVRFQVLLAQMNPHFLLNTLNTVKSIALERDQDDIYEICVSLGKILETTLNTEVDLILLKDEMILIDSYMDIQKARFGHGITISYEVGGELLYALIPKFCLQPLVENALLHGFGQSLQNGHIHIKATTKNALLYLEVADNGVGLEKANEMKASRKRKGIGIQNIRESLQLIFKDQSTGVSLDSNGNGTRVLMHLPLLLSKPYQKEDKTNVADINR
ncbi:sensor histidine kinase [Paenibacillus prosopidis]|uniref:HAMP domain-containing protein n=1 Tax=Paenibacillus prosopidis TaxID=630520 RepID=A0A368W1W2_9BACL|nr:histidine kinase [Paenibacillus prosopidis]RCW48505.1 HAMP domain-containing protein [Paenibacillus prosopidis]